MKFVDICCGIGGISRGFRNVGWEELGGFDIDSDAVLINNLSGGKAIQKSVFDISPAEIKEADVITAGFPCQPFSSSGNRSGVLHHSGNIFSQIISLACAIKVKTIVLENVQGLLSNKNGYTFAVILKMLNDAGYEVSWRLTNASEFGVPQDRKRVLIIAMRNARSLKVLQRKNALVEISAHNISSLVLSDYSVPSITLGKELSHLIFDTEPKIGKAFEKKHFFKTSGIASNGIVATWKDKERISSNIRDVGDFICPNFRNKQHVRSVRYWGHSGKTLPYFKDNGVSHCLGTTIGAGPTFGVEYKYIPNKLQEGLLLENSNWVRKEKNHLIFRVNPRTACYLFGRDFSIFGDVFESSGVSNTKLYKLLGNSVIPEKFESIAREIDANLQTLFS